MHVTVKNVFAFELKMYQTFIDFCISLPGCCFLFICQFLKFIYTMSKYLWGTMFF